MNTNKPVRESTGFALIDKWHEGHCQTTSVCEIDVNQKGLTADLSDVKYYSNELLAAINSPVLLSIYENIYQHNKNNMNSIAMTYFGIKISYKEMFKHINSVTAALCSYGINKGDFISLCLPNVPEIAYFIYAANKIGATVNLIDPRTNSTAILERITECET